MSDSATPCRLTHVGAGERSVRLWRLASLAATLLSLARSSTWALGGQRASTMSETKFTAWRPWADRNLSANVASPGVYAIAISARPLTGLRFTWRKEIVYVGMTNSMTELKGRLRQFDMTMAGRLAHGGADRVRLKHHRYDAFRKRAFVALAPFGCDPTSNSSRDLRIMGTSQGLNSCAWQLSSTGLGNSRNSTTRKSRRSSARHQSRGGPPNERCS